MTLRTLRKTLNLPLWAIVMGGIVSCSDLLGFERGHLAAGDDAGPPLADASLDSGGDTTDSDGKSDPDTPRSDGPGSPETSFDRDNRDTAFDGAPLDVSVDVRPDLRFDVLPETPTPDGGPKCNAVTCSNGCCDANDSCVASPTAGACGKAGERCVVCATGQDCRQGACSCDAATCPAGCCDASGACVKYADQKLGQCGTGGAVCSPCAAGQGCGSAGTCECTPGSCPTGCCQSNKCVAISNQTADVCGSAGNACGSCAMGQACTGGACTCGGSTCAGCCASGKCETSNDDHCGAGGAVCAACQATQDCSPQGKCSCTPSSCPNGCCDVNGVCQTGSTAGACGTGGATCQACAAGQTCGGNACICNGSSCGAGCCNGTSCVPYASQNPMNCGAGGAMCGGCPSGTTCNGAGQCVCNPSSCPTGCCNGNSCVLYPDQSDPACGVVGAACAVCGNGRTCAKSSTGCATWCGLRSAPAGIGAGDYACVDFDTGLPPASTWPATVQAPSTLELITQTFASGPNALEPFCAIGLGGGDAVLTWTAAASGSAVKSISMAAAVNPHPVLQGSTTADMHFLCALIGDGFESRACLSYIYGQGLSLSYRFFFGDAVVVGSCPVTGVATAELWTNMELRFNATTGLLEAIVGGTTSNCQPDNAPPATTIAKAKVGLSTQDISNIGFAIRLDNVVVSVQR